MKAGESEIPPPVKSPSRPLLRLESSPLLFFSHRTYFFLILNLPTGVKPGKDTSAVAKWRAVGRPQKKKRMRPFLSSFRRQGTAELTDSPVVPDSLSDSREKLEIQLRREPLLLKKLSENRKVNGTSFGCPSRLPSCVCVVWVREMERRRAVTVAVMVVVVAAAMARREVAAQSILACTVSMISSFTPCVNYLTGSSNAQLAPTAECCGAFGGLLSSSTSCACQILTGSIPFGLPFNRTLALKLPSYCNSTSIDLFKCPGVLRDLRLVSTVGRISSYLGFANFVLIRPRAAVSPPPPAKVPEAPPQAPPFVIPSSASKPVAYLAGLLAGAAAGALLLKGF
ncbi:unnamed protein product [Spirodela intermedia]|uniref:Bifunctional inhibitor/plant lipid transfer protein/seed storage helical domain-containing protein n=1 Tax=Spirodela intermedia TaxID=51605 RepID=A0A7I8KNJ4_SPIIN|nr:unnamed protein product [Spirodela intermedia]